MQYASTHFPSSSHKVQISQLMVVDLYTKDVFQTNSSQAQLFKAKYLWTITQALH